MAQNVKMYDKVKHQPGLLQNTYSKNFNELYVLPNIVTSLSDANRNYYTAHLFRNSIALNEHKITEIKNSGLFQVDFSLPFVLLMIKLPNCNSNVTFGPESIELRTFLKNQIIENCSKYYTTDVLDVENGYLSGVINVSGHLSEEEVINRLNGILSEISICASKIYGSGFLLSISSIINSYLLITENYNLLKKYQQYGFIYGKNTVIRHEIIKNNLKDTQLRYPYFEENKLIQGIKSKKSEVIETYIECIISKICQMNYNNIILSVIRLCNTIRDIVVELNPEATKNTEPIDILSESEWENWTICYVRKVLSDYINHAICDEDAGQNKHSKLIAAVKKYIESNYFNTSLCLNFVSDYFKISPNYLNRIFKGMTALSIKDYITNFRLKKAANLIETTGKNVYVIMQTVGIENESFFYKKFKNEYGVTPKSYQNDRICIKNRLINDNKAALNLDAGRF